MDEIRKTGVKSTVWDVLETAPVPLFPGAGLISIYKLQKKIDSRDLILVNLYFKDELWLIKNDVFDLAVAGMIIKLEARLRKQLLMLPQEKRPNDKELEKMTLDKLRLQLEPIISPDSNRLIQIINRKRRAFIHTNMIIGEEILGDNEIALLFQKLRSDLSPVQKHESTKSSLRFHSCDVCVDLMVDCLSVLRELNSDTIEEIYPSFDDNIHKQLQIRRDMDFLTNEINKKIKSRGHKKNFLEKLWHALTSSQ